MKINIRVKVPTAQIKAEGEQLARDYANKVALDIYGDLVMATPVDKGAARQGWQLDDAGNRIEISNSVPYIGRLNEGHSKQAPAGFIEAVVDKHTR